MLSKQVNKKKMGVIERLRRQGISSSPVPTSLSEEEDELASASRMEDGTTEEEDTYGIEVPVATSARDKKKTRSKKANRMA